MLALLLDAPCVLAAGLNLVRAVEIPLGGSGGQQLLALSSVAVPEHRRLAALLERETIGLGLETRFKRGNVPLGLLDALRRAGLPVERVGCRPAGRLQERGPKTRRRRVGRLLPRQGLTDGGNAPALAFGQVAGLCGKRGVLPGPGRGLFPQMALVLAAAGIALPRRPRKLAFPAAHVGAVDALMPGRGLAAAARLETAMLDADGAGVKRQLQGLWPGLPAILQLCALRSR